MTNNRQRQASNGGNASARANNNNNNNYLMAIRGERVDEMARNSSSIEAYRYQQYQANSSQRASSFEVNAAPDERNSFDELGNSAAGSRLRHLLTQHFVQNQAVDVEAYNQASLWSNAASPPDRASDRFDPFGPLTIGFGTGPRASFTDDQLFNCFNMVSCTCFRNKNRNKLIALTN